MYGIDYAQVVDPTLDEKLGDLQELQWKLKDLLDEMKVMHRDVRDEFSRLYYAIDEYKGYVEDAISETEREIQEQLESVSPSWCD